MNHDGDCEYRSELQRYRNKFVRCYPLSYLSNLIAQVNLAEAAASTSNVFDSNRQTRGTFFVITIAHASELRSKLHAELDNLIYGLIICILQVTIQAPSGRLPNILRSNDRN